MPTCFVCSTAAASAEPLRAEQDEEEMHLRLTEGSQRKCYFKRMNLDVLWRRSRCLMQKIHRRL